MVFGSPEPEVISVVLTSIIGCPAPSTSGGARLAMRTGAGEGALRCGKTLSYRKFFNAIHIRLGVCD